MRRNGCSSMFFKISSVLAQLRSVDSFDISLWFNSVIMSLAQAAKRQRLMQQQQRQQQMMLPQMFGAAMPMMQPSLQPMMQGMPAMMPPAQPMLQGMPGMMPFQQPMMMQGMGPAMMNPAMQLGLGGEMEDDVAEVEDDQLGQEGQAVSIPAPGEQCPPQRDSMVYNKTSSALISRSNNLLRGVARARLVTGLQKLAAELEPGYLANLGQKACLQLLWVMTRLRPSCRLSVLGDSVWLQKFCKIQANQNYSFKKSHQCK